MGQERSNDKESVEKKKVAILGWGSLVWDPRPAFDNFHGEWNPDGPMLKLEFSRKSGSRKGALTLVIDAKHGEECRVKYAYSKRSDAEDAICDLRSREGTTLKNIGFFFADGRDPQARDKEALKAISDWAKQKSIDVVVWTDLEGCFADTAKENFVKEAIKHIQGLVPEGKAKAAEYVWRAPDLADTPLRRALQQEPWFRKARRAGLRTPENT